MRTSLCIAFAASVVLLAGCSWWKEHHFRSTDQEYAHLLELYQIGKIDLLQLTSRQNALALRQKYARTHSTPDSDSSSTTDTATDKDDKCKDHRHRPEPGKPCPPVSGRH